MKVLIAATALTGHVNPLLAVGRLLAERGDEVIVTTSSAFADRIEAAGFRFLASPDSDEAEYLATELPPGPERWRREFARRFIDPMPAQADHLRRLIAREAPDVVVAGSLFLGVLPLLRDPRHRPPIVVLNVSFLFLDRPDGAPVGLGLPPARDGAELARYADLKARFDAAFVGPVRAHADRRLAELGLPPLPASLTQSIATLPDAFLQPSVPAFEYGFDPLPRNLRFVGLLPGAPSRLPLPEWWPAPDDRRRIVLVTQGTLANADLGQLVGPTLEALAGRDDLLVVATTGGRPVEELGGPLPVNARAARFLPFDLVLPRVDLLVTNGGYGSVSQALREGVPIVAAGTTEDKAEISARVGWSGAGVNLATSTPTVDAVRDAVAAVLDGPAYRERARALADAFAACDPAREILSAIDESVGRTRSRAA